MDKNNRRVIRMKEVILNIFIAVILASFGIWLIGGITYNVFQKEQIHQRILALEKKAYDIEPLEAYDVSDFQLTNRRAIIAKSIRTYIKPITSDKSPQIVKEEFLQYFMSHGWNIKHAWENPKPYLQVENDDYIETPDFTLELDDVVISDIFLSLPSKNLCRDDCKGLCQICGQNLNNGECSCDKRQTDPRLEILKQLID